MAYVPSVRKRGRMPELPEVETITRQLRGEIMGQMVRKVRVFDPKLQDQGLERIEGRVVSSLCRRGKYIIFGFGDRLYLIAHLRMTGQFSWRRDGGDLPKHLRAIFRFGSGNLCYADQRRFGTLTVRDDLDTLSRLGIEPLNPGFNGGFLYQIVQRNRLRTKELLMDQYKIAGIGNIYASEILFSAYIHPQRRANSLSKAEADRLAARTKDILNRAIQENGTTVANYLDAGGERGRFQGFLQVYGREGEACPVCGSLIERIRQSGRSTYFCPHCQGQERDGAVGPSVTQP
jgi:formamidopyrimidine-DNA glycosylase